MIMVEIISHFSPDRFRLVTKTIARAVQLYELRTGEEFAPSRLGKYLERWTRWLYSGITLRTKEANAVPWDFPENGFSRPEVFFTAPRGAQ
jgi:hypothetical protein